MIELNSTPTPAADEPPAAGEIPVYQDSLAGSLIDSARISVMAALFLTPKDPPPLLLELDSEHELTLAEHLVGAMEWLDAARAITIARRPEIVTSLHAVHGNAESGTCAVCGCTESNACHTEDGPCYWVNEEHTLCSNPKCVATMMEVTA